MRTRDLASLRERWRERDTYTQRCERQTVRARARTAHAREKETHTHTNITRRANQAKNLGDGWLVYFYIVVCI